MHTEIEWQVVLVDMILGRIWGWGGGIGDTFTPPPIAIFSSSLPENLSLHHSLPTRRPPYLEAYLASYEDILNTALKFYPDLCSLQHTIFILH